MLAHAPPPARPQSFDKGHVPSTRLLFAAAAWLAATLVIVKAYYLGVPGVLALGDRQHYLRSLAAISHGDALFAASVWCVGRAAVAGFRRRPTIARAVAHSITWFCAGACLYAVANVTIFGLFGGFLTYPLLALVGDVRMLRSSVAAYLTGRVVMGLLVVPAAYLALVWLTARRYPTPSAASWRRVAIAGVSLVVWIALGQYAWATEWITRQDRRIAENAHWVLISSWWQAVSGDAVVRMADPFRPADLADFEPIGFPPRPADPVGIRRISAPRRAVRPAVRRPPNVVLVVLESVGARWASLNTASIYDTTPNLRAASTRGLVFDNAYAHIGRSSNSLAALLLSTYPKLGFRDITEEYPRLPGTSLASLFQDRGYRTSFVTPSDLEWAGWRTFLEGRGFQDIRDHKQLTCSEPLSSWGVEDRCMFDGMLEFIEQAPAEPFFIMAWSQQTHHPYEPTPGVPMVNLMKEPVADAYDLGRYLNVLRETDRHLGRFFDAVREKGLDEDTLIVVTGDHGQAFGYPHDSYGQGRTVYDEDVHVPLLFRYPRRFNALARSNVVGAHVDIAPTIMDLLGLPPAPDWFGRSLLSDTRPPRAYFYVAEDQFRLGVREGSWKYIYDLRGGVEELYDVEHDPTEQANLADVQPARSARLRQRLAAWTEANRRQYERLSAPGVQRAQAGLATH